MDIFGIIYKALAKLNKLVTGLRKDVDNKQAKLTYADGNEITDYKDLKLSMLKGLPFRDTVLIVNDTKEDGHYVTITTETSSRDEIIVHDQDYTIYIKDPVKYFYSDWVEGDFYKYTSACLSLKTSEIQVNHFRDFNKLTYCGYIDTMDSSTVSLSSCFYNCRKLSYIPDYFVQVPITSMWSTFYGCESLTRLPELNTSKVTDFNSTLENSGATEIPKSWTFDEALTFKSFAESSNLIEVEMHSYATNWSRAFSNCSKLININIQANKAEDCMYLCWNCEKLKNAELFFETGNNIEAHSLFDGCVELETAEVDTYYATFKQLSYAFSECRKLKTIAGLSALSSTCELSNTFSQCYSLENFEGFYFHEGDKITGNYDFRDSPKLTVESMQSIMSYLNNQQANLIFNTEAFNKLTPEDIAVATNKGWSVMSSPQN